jgi:hypothetical protein
MELPSWFPEPWVIILSVVLLVGTIIACVIVIVRLPRDHFVNPPKEPKGVAAIVRNVLGAILILGGIAMLVLPGQGVLAILAGILLTTFKGKQKLVRKIVQKPKVEQALQWIREKANRPPLEIPDQAAA